MAIFGKKEKPNLDDILKLIEELSEEEREKVKDLLLPKSEEESKEAEVVATDEEAEKVEETPNQDNAEAEAETAPETQSEEQPQDDPETEENIEPHEEEQQEAKEEEKENAYQAEIAAMRSDISELKAIIAEIVQAFENRPFGAKGTTAPIDEDNGKWEGPATKSYFRK